LREYFVLFLGNTGSKKSKDFLLELYKDEEENKTIRAYAVNAISKLGIKEAAPDIKEVLKQIDSYSFKKKKRFYSLSIYSITALVKLGDSEALPRLIDSLKSNNMAIRLRAIKLLKDLKDKRTIDILKYKIKYDPSVKVQKAAKEALKGMGIDVDKEKEDLKKKKNQKKTENPEKFNEKKKLIKKSKKLKK
jgi:HEAT repeat protein